jgi:hypothetical protein
MPKITDKPLEAIQLRLFKDDLDELRLLYAGQFGVNKAIRTIVHSFINQVRSKAAKAIDNTETMFTEQEE